ncbi:MAG: hypothetical protein KKD46_01235 [Euryarchaeota archaeon]|nr:hypothetical protein [Euryarchaeota archaeon]MBU4339532.1 hypothetical protein [Euryarchaeota archaeon]
MEPKDSTFYPLIILFFILGLVMGYVIHQPGTEIKYINTTIEVPVEKIVETTASPTSTASTIAPTSTQVPDFEVRNFDPEKDKPERTIELVNWQAMPDQISIRPGQIVLIKVVNYPEQSPPNFIMDTYERKLGTSGMIVITFNKIGTYEYKAIIPNEDKSILPKTYAKGSIRVY